MDNIAKFCIKHKVTTLMAVIMISIFGVVFTTQLQMALLPDMEAPAAITEACQDAPFFVTRFLKFFAWAELH